MKLKAYIWGAGVAAAGLLAPSCTDMEPEVSSDVLKEDYYKTPEQFATLLANAYAQLAGEYGYVYREGYWSMQEYTTDEVAVPTRGTEWSDNGVPIAMGQHKWEENTRDVNNGWSFAYGGVTKCNGVLDNIKIIKGEDEAQYDDATKFGIAETKVLRAFYHLLAMDLYGNVPIVDASDAVLKQSSRTEVFSFIEREVKDNLPYLQVTPSYGRVTKSVGQTILAKLYLNAEVYTGAARWQDALSMCDSVIGGGYGYALESDYFAPFKVSNTGCKEIIFPVVFDAVKAQGNMFHLMTLHYAHAYPEVYGFTTQTWNGPCAHEDFYNAYEEGDKRKAQWFVGPITDKSTGDTINFIKGSVNKKAIIVPTISATVDATEENTFEGARFVKFEIEPGIGHHANSDFPIYRLADIYLMKAEALLRLGNSGEAVIAANEVRKRTGLTDYTTATLTLTELLAERGRELAWEGHRRQDLIRFGEFTKQWGKMTTNEYYKPASDGEHRTLFPIPKWVTDAAPGVYTQNAGYN
ncbi:MAG: RagB/SusD family nutrient uptake outer membrane protein [Prevotellaceae bacterium]|jgi:hypothetical protein|nr:RagB/SusD family nutrient uptake outer membrane protein [Prevotellaceae bacterium]